MHPYSTVFGFNGLYILYVTGVQLFECEFIEEKYYFWGGYYMIYWNETIGKGRGSQAE
jgi:hypothetical protein